MQDFVKLFPKGHTVKGVVKKMGVMKVDEKNLTANIVFRDESVNKFLDLITKCKVKSFKEIKFTLEDYFMQFYKEDKDFGGAMQWKKKKK